VEKAWDWQCKCGVPLNFVGQKLNLMGVKAVCSSASSLKSEDKKASITEV
jgi:hypothetical protein